MSLPLVPRVAEARRTRGAGLLLALRVAEGEARRYRRVWKGSVVTAFLNPILFLVAMGHGVGSLVDRGAATGLGGGISYVEFLAPGLLAATAMQTAAGESTWPVMAGIKWLKTYRATLATPVGTRALVSGNLLWTGVRTLMAAVAFAIVMVVLDAASPGEVASAMPGALLVGLAFAAPLTAYTAIAKNETRLSTIFRFAIIPMFLFSGTFFPIEQLPGWMQPAAYVTPLWHGVELCRAAALGVRAELPTIVHASYLGVWAIAGWLWASRNFRKTLRQ